MRGGPGALSYSGSGGSAERGGPSALSDVDKVRLFIKDYPANSRILTQDSILKCSVLLVLLVYRLFPAENRGQAGESDEGREQDHDGGHTWHDDTGT